MLAKKNSAQPKPRIFVFVMALVAVILLLTASVLFFVNYTTNSLYKESVSQLSELSSQLIEKLEVQIDMQWGYLEKLQDACSETSSLTEDELSEKLEHYEKDLAPVNKTMYLRAIDSFGYYYTSEGREGSWSGLYKIDESADKQSFVIANWPSSENYMAFIVKVDNSLTVDGNEIKRFVLLRSMEDMVPYFHSTAFNNHNLVYIMDGEGLLLFSDGQLEGAKFVGKNIFHSMSEQTYPHFESFDAIRKENEDGTVVCSDVIISGNKFFLIFDQMSSYDWGMLLLVSADDVAINTTKMVYSLFLIFGLVILVIVIALVVTLLLLSHIRRDKDAFAFQTENARILEESNSQLKVANDELQKSRQETEKALNIAQQATKAKSQFLANMSHDIRTPMNAIVGMTKLMEHEVKNPEKLTYYINKLRHSSQYMLGLINDILDMSKIESGDVHINLETVKMAEQVGQIESIIRSQCAEKNQEFTVHVHEITHEYLIGDTIRLRQVFLNLLTNAVKYTPEGGKICFELTELPCDKPNHATILTSVIDNGIGMSEEFQNRMFDPFAREKTSLTNKIGGTGLGLSIAKNIVDLMGGTITVHSKLGEGSRFEVLLTLPIDEIVPEIPLKKLLLATEEETLVKNVKAALKDRHVELLIANNTDEALAVLNSNSVEAVLLSGYLNKEVLSKTVESLRQSAKSAIFIFCCDYAHKENVRDMLIESGVDGLIARPFFVENLILAIDHVQNDIPIEEADKHSVLSGKRFLCAEDNELNAEILEALLNLHGATCVIYQNGAELVKAFADVKEGDYDAILMDVQMPIMNGMEATREIRKGQNPLGKTIPILAMTANAFSSDVKDCLNAGMDAHLPKPLDITALERALQEIQVGGG